MSLVDLKNSCGFERVCGFLWQFARLFARGFRSRLPFCLSSTRGVLVSQIQDLCERCGSRHISFLNILSNALVSRKFC